MHNFLKWFFEPKDAPFDITFLSVWHILFLLIIVSLTLLLTYYLVKHPEKQKKVLDTLIYALVIVYIADFFIRPFTRDDFTMSIDKLPFHICTCLCPVSALTHFNKHFTKFKEPVGFLSVVAPLMYIVYPGSAIGDISPFCYDIIQTFVFHGLLFSWGVNTIATQVKPNIRNCYKALIGIVLIAAWATIGNLSYNESYLGNTDASHYDWFFLTGTTFPFVPPVLMPFVVIACIFAMVLIIYGIYYATVHFINKKKNGAQDNSEETENTEITV